MDEIWTKTMYEICTSRNNLKYDKTQLPQETIIAKILIQLQNILTAHYKLHKLNETLTLFQQLFCINNAIAKIDNAKLQILLPWNNDITKTNKVTTSIYFIPPQERHYQMAQRLMYECPTVKVIYRVTREPPFTPDYSHQIH